MTSLRPFSEIIQRQQRELDEARKLRVEVERLEAAFVRQTRRSTRRRSTATRDRGVTMESLDLIGILKDDPPEVVTIDGWVFVLADDASQPKLNP